MEQNSVSVARRGPGGVEVNLPHPQTSEEWEAFWAERIADEDTQGAVNELAYRQFVVAAQAATRPTLDDHIKAGDVQDTAQAAVQKALDDYQYSQRRTGGGGGGRKAKRTVNLEQAKSLGLASKRASDIEAWKEAMASLNIDVTLEGEDES